MTIQCSDTFTKLMGAMLKVQDEVRGVTKDSTNPHFKNRYASLEAVVAALRPACVEAGIVVVQAPGTADERGMTPVETLIVHAESGEWMKSTLALPVMKADAQGVGSAISYSSRYSLMALFNLPPTDDDGEEAVRPITERKSSYRAKKDGDFDGVEEAIRACKTVAELEAWRIANGDKLAKMPMAFVGTINEEIYEPKLAELRKAERKPSDVDSAAARAMLISSLYQAHTTKEITEWRNANVSVFKTMNKQDQQTVADERDARLAELFEKEQVDADTGEVMA